MIHVILIRLPGNCQNEVGRNHKRVSQCTETHWAGCIKHLKATLWNCNPSILIYILLRRVRHQGKHLSCNISNRWLNFHARFIYLQRERCQSPRHLFTAPNQTQIHYFTGKCALSPPFLVSDLTLFNQAFLLAPKWLICTIKSSIKASDVLLHFASKDPLSWATAPIIALQNKYKKVLPCSDIPIRLWKSCLCEPVRIASAMIAPYSCGNN